VPRLNIPFFQMADGPVGVSHSGTDHCVRGDNSMRELKQEEIEYAIGRLDVYMASRGLNQSDLKGLSGVEQSTISKILHRRQEPSLENLQKLFGGLGLQLCICAH
jgi:DNA-binding phage protein